MLGNAAWIWPHENLDAFELVVVLKKFAGRIRRRLFMKIPFDISAAAGIDLSCGLFDPFIIDTVAYDPILPYILIMPLGFDHCAVRFATVVIADRLTRRGIGEAESEPRGQRRLPLRIDF